MRAASHFSLLYYLPKLMSCRFLMPLICHYATLRASARVITRGYFRRAISSTAASSGAFTFSLIRLLFYR